MAAIIILLVLMLIVFSVGSALLLTQLYTLTTMLMLKPDELQKVRALVNEKERIKSNADSDDA